MISSIGFPFVPHRRNWPTEIRQVTGQQVTEFEQLTMEEQIEVTDELKKFTILCMRCYSINFRREKIKGVEDILWFGRIGNARYYKGTDRDVKEGRAKLRGTGNPGCNSMFISSCHGTM